MPCLHVYVHVCIFMCVCVVYVCVCVQYNHLLFLHIQAASYIGCGRKVVLYMEDIPTTGTPVVEGIQVRIHLFLWAKCQMDSKCMAHVGMPMCDTPACLVW